MLPILLGLFLATTTGSVPERRIHATAQAPAQQGDPQRADEIFRLKQRALDAELNKELPKARDLYIQILRLAPDDAMAKLSLEKVQKALDARQIESVEDLVRRREQEGQDKKVKDAVTEGNTHLARFNQGGSSTELDLAETALAEAKQAAKAREYDEITRLERAVAAARTAQTNWRYEFWGGLGVVFVLVVAGIFFYFWRRTRTLEMIAGPTPGQLFVLRGAATTLGALAGEVDWAIADPQRQISRQHCIVLRRGRHYWVVDRSTNGTFLNGRPVPRDEAALLKRGDQITLGRDVVLRVR